MMALVKLKPIDRQESEQVIIGIQQLSEVLRVKLLQIKNKEDIGIRDAEGLPVRSIRHFARHIGNEEGYAYISKFTNEKAIPCMVILNQIANGMGVQYQISNF